MIVSQVSQTRHHYTTRLALISGCPYGSKFAAIAGRPAVVLSDKSDLCCVFHLVNCLNLKEKPSTVAARYLEVEDCRSPTYKET
jgi:hypothetical protein